jgi:hypothetical protein
MDIERLPNYPGGPEDGLPYRGPMEDRYTFEFAVAAAISIVIVIVIALVSMVVALNGIGFGMVG